MINTVLLRTLRSALVSIAAVVASFGVTYAICTRLSVNTSPAILAAALSVGLMRRPERLERRALLTKFVTLPLIALAAGLIGLVFSLTPVLGAVLFSGGTALSIWLRRYGEHGSTIGRTIALPLMSTLAVPLHVNSARNGLIPALLVIAAGVIAFTSTVVVSWLAAHAAIADKPKQPHSTRPRPTHGAEMPVATRMALRMLAALGLAFALGMLAFPVHWSWVVLSAFIVCGGAISRGDAIYKGLLRLGGAIGGTLAAAILAHVVFPNPAAYAAVIFIVLFLSIWLRQINYAYWAAGATLVFALLQRSQSADVVPLFAIRVCCIAIGALCGVAATWFVYPIRTEQMVRRCVADALAALRDVLTRAPEDPEYQSRLAALDHHAIELKRFAPPVHLHRTVFSPKHLDEHPATWLDLTQALLAEAQTRGFDRAHVGAEMRRLRKMLRARPAVSTANEEPPTGIRYATAGYDTNA